MARRKKGHKKRTTRRRGGRRVGAAKDLLQQGAAVAVGAIAGKVLVNVLAKNFTIVKDNPDTDAKIKAALPIVIGGIVHETIGKKQPMARFAAYGMIGAGAADLGSKLGIIQGMQRLAGMLDTPVSRSMPQQRIASRPSYSNRLAGITDTVNDVALFG